MRIAIIGATGNIGTALLRRLAKARGNNERADGIDVLGIARRLPDRACEPYRGVQWHALDVAAEEVQPRLTSALEGCDAVVHLAWLLQPNHDEAALRRVNVRGTERVLATAAAAGVRHVVCSSSVGAYSAGPKDRRVVEQWPARGIASSQYSRFKGEQEELLDRFAAAQPGIQVARLRPGLVFQEDAGSEIARYFLGPLLPTGFLRWRLPLVPIPPEFVFQAVHADDVADAFWRVLDAGAFGAFNVAAEPVLNPELVAGVLGAKRWLPVPARVARAVVGASWAVHLQASDPGWIDMAVGAPVMDTSRIRSELGWDPARSSLGALREILDGMAHRHGVPGSPPLAPRKRWDRSAAALSTGVAEGLSEDGRGT